MANDTNQATGAEDTEAKALDTSESQAETNMNPSQASDEAKGEEESKSAESQPEPLYNLQHLRDEQEKNKKLKARLDELENALSAKDGDYQGLSKKLQSQLQERGIEAERWKAEAEEWKSKYEKREIEGKRKSFVDTVLKDVNPAHREIAENALYGLEARGKLELTPPDKDPEAAVASAIETLKNNNPMIFTKGTQSRAGGNLPNGQIHQPAESRWNLPGNGKIVIERDKH